MEYARADLRGELDEDAEPPELVGYLYSWFNDLSDWRASAMSVGPLSHLEIECWARLFRLEPPIGPFEVDVLRRLDRICRAHYATRDDEPNETDRTIGEQLRAIADDPNKDGYADG